MTELKFENGKTMTFKTYNSNVAICYDGEWHDQGFDQCCEYSTDENVEAALEDVIDFFNPDLTENDKSKLIEELHDVYYSHSKEIFE